MIEAPTPRFGISNVAEHLPHLCFFVSVTYSDSWVEISFELPSARALDFWLEVHALRRVSVQKRVCYEGHILHLRIWRILLLLITLCLLPGDR